MKKISLLIILITSITFIKSVNAASNGSCGPDCNYTLDNEGNLIISGTGSITSKPWASEISSIKSIDIQNGITSIGRYSFSNATNLTSLTIGNTVTNIQDSAFSNARNLKNFTIPNSVTTIGEYAFEYNTSLTDLTIPDSVTSIGNAAFTNASSLKNLTIGNSLQTIPAGAFGYSYALENVVIGNSVSSIEVNAFRETGLKNLTIPDSSIDMDRSFFLVTISELTINAENLEKYLNALGRLDTNIVCTSGNCKAVLEAWDSAKGTNYASTISILAKSQQIVNDDGSISIYENGRLISTRGKRIYTVDEAERVSKPTGNKIMIRYK